MLKSRSTGECRPCVGQTKISRQGGGYSALRSSGRGIEITL